MRSSTNYLLRNNPQYAACFDVSFLIQVYIRHDYNRRRKYYVVLLNGLIVAFHYLIEVALYAQMLRDRTTTM